MSYPAVGLRPQSQDQMDQLVAQTNNLSLQPKTVPVKPQPSKQDLIVEACADSVVKTLTNVFLKEMKECADIRKKGEVPEGRVIGISKNPIDSAAISTTTCDLYIRADKVINTYVTPDFKKNISAILENSKEVFIMNAIHQKAITKLYQRENIVVRGCLNSCGPQDQDKDAFIHADLLKVVCLRMTQEALKKL